MRSEYANQDPSEFLDGLGLLVHDTGKDKKMSKWSDHRILVLFIWLVLIFLSNVPKLCNNIRLRNGMNRGNRD